ncbi:hypothetical protein SADUNF_Sadunf10G0094200 [Salix dunnii]|uniref:DNA-directed RNA polymerase subunit 2 hybrid-binding domain-containing protein n=1 Tax=Salix dunnii TaxID=1413687 RepID=A0A835JRY2_9ROSI|nr:hypothetical protein SADUNF_Sadunf10G0094200 [Salix dunnii]
MQSGDIVIGKCAESVTDHRVKLKYTERGMVQKVVLLSKDEGKNFAVVRSPRLGDKFFKHEWAKGRSGLFGVSRELPFHNSRSDPDIVIKQHALTSRQTTRRNLLKSSGRKCMFSACELSWKILCVELKIYAEMHGYFSENLHAELCISRLAENSIRSEANIAKDKALALSYVLHSLCSMPVPALREGQDACFATKLSRESFGGREGVERVSDLKSKTASLADLYPNFQVLEIPGDLLQFPSFLNLLKVALLLHVPLLVCLPDLVFPFCLLCFQAHAKHLHLLLLLSGARYERLAAFQQEPACTNCFLNAPMQCHDHKCRMPQCTTHFDIVFPRVIEHSETTVRWFPDSEAKLQKWQSEIPALICSHCKVDHHMLGM